MKYIQAHSIAVTGYIKSTSAILDLINGWADGDGGKCFDSDTFYETYENSNNEIIKEFVAEVRETFKDKEELIGDIVIYCK